jgi:hypothetical protein
MNCAVGAWDDGNASRQLDDVAAGGFPLIFIPVNGAVDKAQGTLQMSVPVKNQSPVAAISIVA